MLYLNSLKLMSKDETTTTEIMEFLRDNMVTKEDLKSFATKEDLKLLATKEDLKQLEGKMNARFESLESRM